MIRRELFRFLIIGSLTVIIDFLAYRSLVWIDVISVDASKAFSFLVGSVFAYFANRVWTFGHKAHLPGSAWRFAILYAVALSTNVFVNSQTLTLLSGSFASIEIAFLLATLVSASLNFLGMKLFVFESKFVSKTL
jgi:putative flippase GtrA